MARINLIYNRLFDRNGSGTVCVGGVETYILRLSRLILDLGHEPVLYQQACRPFEEHIQGLRVIGIAPQDAAPTRLYRSACQADGGANPVVVFCAEQVACRSRSRRSILIQNGIYWDMPNRYWTSRLQQGPVLGFVSRLYTTLCKIRDIHYARYRVCVDLNFVNWYRSVCDEPSEARMFYIPNCCKPLPEPEVNEKLQRNGGIVQIVFARRFVKHRGTRIFAEACSRIAREFPQVRILVCGEGPEEPFLRRALGQVSNICITRIPWPEMAPLLKRTDIAVVPSLGSEGTSFSLVEAMGAACAVICSNVGGMTNMVIPEHNGLLIWPTASDCYARMRELVVDRQKRERLAQNAWQTARDSFCEEKWTAKWREVLRQCISDDDGAGAREQS